MEEQPAGRVGITLLEVLVAIALTGAIEELFRSTETGMHWWAIAAATAALSLTTINFYHGKVATQTSGDYQRAKIARPAVALFDFWLNILVIICLNCIAFTLDRPEVWTGLVYAFRGIDSVLVLFTLFVADESDRDVRWAQRSWLGIDIGFIALLAVGALLFPIYLVAEFQQLALSFLFLGLTLVDIALDYSLNHRLYFSVASSWREQRMADLWDSEQGRDGLEDSRQIIQRTHESLADSGWDWKGRKVLDLGCGNGWLSRWLCNKGAKVVGIDQSKALLDKAIGYGANGITYSLADFTSTKVQFADEPYDAIVSMFSMQDCQSIGRAFKFAMEKMAPGGFLIVVFENDNLMRSADYTRHSMSRRRWLNHSCQLICWRRRGEAGDEWDPRFVTITHHWGQRRYEEEARKNGLDITVMVTAPEKFIVLKCTKRVHGTGSTQLTEVHTILKPPERETSSRAGS